MAAKKLTIPQKRLLSGLIEAYGSGIFDRWIRIIAGGEVITSPSSAAIVTAFRKGWIAMDGDRVRITAAGRQAAE